jgi:hypothetical protein
MKQTMNLTSKPTGDKKPGFETTYTRCTTRGAISFSPFGKNKVTYRIDPTAVDSIATLQQQVSRSGAGGRVDAFPLDAIVDLHRMATVLTDSNFESQVARAFGEVESEFLVQTDYWRELPNGTIEVRAGDSCRSFPLGTFYFTASGLLQVLEELKDEPWFTAEVKGDLAEFVARLGSYYEDQLM